MNLNFLNFRKSRKGAALIIALLSSIISLFAIVTISNMASTNNIQIAEDKQGKVAYYAAEAGVEDIKNFFNMNQSVIGQSLGALNLPLQSAPYTLSNGSKYWIDSLSYADSNKTIIVNVVGSSDGAFRKIRARMNSSVSSLFNDYGLLTNGVLTIHGTKVLRMNVHGNSGLSFSGGNTMENNAVATQSINSSAGLPHTQTNPVGGYVPKIDIPIVPIDSLRAKSKSDSKLLSITQSDLKTQISTAPANSQIYISTSSKKKDNVITLSGDLGGKTIFLDGDVVVDIDGGGSLTNGTIITAGKLTVNGSVDIVTSHPDQIDVVFASGDDVNLNGSRDFKCLFWSNGVFTQNGASLAGRVVAQEAIFLNGSFVLTSSEALAANSAFDQIINVSSWQQVPMS